MSPRDAPRWIIRSIIAGEIMISWYNVFSVATCGALGGKSEKSDVLTFVERSQ